MATLSMQTSRVAAGVRALPARRTALVCRAQSKVGIGAAGRSIRGAGANPFCRVAIAKPTHPGPAECRALGRKQRF